MLIVPLRGDQIETKEGISFKVLSYTNYRPKGPAVYVEHTPSVPSDAVYFFDIQKINGKTVKFIGSSKVFRSVSPIKRRYQLPQPYDIITWKTPDGAQDAVIKNLRLHKRGELSKGLLLELQNADKEPIFIRLSQIIRLKRDIGNDLFSREVFLKYYNDYTGNM